MIRRQHSVFMDRMKRSTMAIEPCLSTAPKRRRIRRRRHQTLKVRHQNWRPLSVTIQPGVVPAARITRPRNAVISPAVGR
jgi:hypothetical protein